MRTVSLTLPTKWSELTASQLIIISRLFIASVKFHPFEFLTYIFTRITGSKVMGPADGKYMLKLKGEKRFIVPLAHIHSIVGNLKWILDEVTEIRPLPSIRRAKAINARMHGTRFIQFLTAENFFMAFKSTKDPAHLDCLVACLYLKPGQKFDDHLVKRRSRYFRYVSAARKYTAFLWYAGFRTYLATQFTYLFEKGDSDEQVSIKAHVLAMIRGLTEGDVTKNKAVTYDVDTWDALHELDAKVKYAKELEAKFKK